MTSTRLQAWLELGRVANLPSALANVWMGLLVATGGWSPVWQWFLLSLASAALYTSGMILNDWWDFDEDVRERPERPLPSGRVSRAAAGWAGFGLLVTGVILAGAAGGLMPSPIWRPLVVALLLAASIVLYDIVLKRTAAAPWLMGICRGLNVLLGASPALTVGGWSGFAAPVLWIAGCLAIYVAGITWLARNEAGTVSRRPLVLGLVLVVVALIGYSSVVQSPQFLQLVRGPRDVWLFSMLMVAIGLPVIRRAARAIRNLQPRTVRGAVITALRSMVILDASVCVVAGQGSLFYGLAVLALLPLGLLLNSVSRHT